MNKEQRKFKKVIKARRKRQRWLKAERARKAFAKMAPSIRQKILFERRQLKAGAKKNREEIMKDLKQIKVEMTDTTSTTNK